MTERSTAAAPRPLRYRKTLAVKERFQMASRRGGKKLRITFAQGSPHFPTSYYSKGFAFFKPQRIAQLQDFL